MISTTNTIKVAEEEQKHELQVKSSDLPVNSNVFADYEKVKPIYGKNYGVPHFGEDSDIVATKKNIADAEASLGATMTASFASANPYGLGPDANPHKTNYFVPHFGEDEDIKSTKSNVAAAEKKYEHVYDGTKPDPPKRDYFVPNFGMDSDINGAKDALAATEK